MPRGACQVEPVVSAVRSGAVSGMFWGTLVGLLFMMPLVGATSGALGGKLTDVGINDDFMRKVGKTLQSGNAALFLLVRKMTTDKVAAALQETGATVLRSSFDETKESALQAPSLPAPTCRYGNGRAVPRGASP